jgi:Dicarboxylate transport
MNPPDSPVDDSDGHQDEPRSTTRKPRSTKQFLLLTATRFSIGLGILSVLGLGAWLARNQLVTLTLESFLRSKGVPADISVENLQLGTAQIRNLRLGSGDKPSLVADRTTITWHVDSQARLFVVDRLQIDGVTARLSVDANGKPDFGALAPLLKSSGGPKRSVVNGVTLSNAQVLVDTPFGAGQAKLSVWGGENVGWTGRADVTPPAQLRPANQVGAYEPIPIGFAVRTVDAATALGFFVRPNGQGLSYSGMTALGLTGTLNGEVRLNPDKSIRVDTRASSLQARRITGRGFEVADLNIALNPLFWTHREPWKTTGWGNLIATGSVSNLTVPRSATFKSGLTLGNSAFRIGAARAQSGRMQLDYLIDGRRLSGPFGGQKLQLSGNVATTLVDMTQLATADLAGRGMIEAAGITLPASLSAQSATATPPALAGILSGQFSGRGTFDYRTGQKGSQLSLAGPFSLSSSNGARVSWASSGGQAPTLFITPQTNGTSVISALGTGQIGLTMPDYGIVQGKLEGATFGPSGWAIVARNIDARALDVVARRLGMSASARLDRLSLSAGRTGAINGEGRGQVLIQGDAGTPRAGRAVLAFDGRATPNSVTGTLSGPFEGFGAVMGLGGLGVRGGTVSLTGSGVQTGSSWEVSTNGRVAGYALSTDHLNLSAPTLTLRGQGRLSANGSVTGSAQLSGGAQSAAPLGQSARLGFSGIDLDGRASFNGLLTALNVTGGLTSRVARADGAGFDVGDARTDLQFAGQIGTNGLRLRGTTDTRFARLSSTSGATRQAIRVSDARASGPFSVGTGTLANAAPFWNDRLGIARSPAGLSLMADLAVTVADLRAPNAQLSNARVQLPIRAGLSQSGAWSAGGRATGFAARANLSGTDASNVTFDTPFDLRGSGPDAQGSGTLTARATSLMLAGTRLSDISVAGPFDGRMGGSGLQGGGWQGGGRFAIGAGSLVTGETRLLGLNAMAPLRLASGAKGALVVSAANCLDFTARSGRFPGEASVGRVAGKVCPDSAGQLAVLGGPSPRIMATTALDPIAIQIGGPDGDQRIDLGEINGTMGLKPNGSLALNFLASQFGFSLKLPDGTTALVKANEAALDVTPIEGGVRLQGRIGRLSSLGLPILISGGADANFVAGPRGLNGSFGFDNILVKDVEKSPRFGEFNLAGVGNISGNRITIAGDVSEPLSKIKVATLVLDHNIASGGGRLAVDASDLLMSPNPISGRRGLDVATLIPPLRGVVTDLTGVLNGTSDIAWERGQPIVSGARIDTAGLDFGIMLGPVSGLTGKIELDDLLTVRTAGKQTIKLRSLNTGGIPIEDGTIEFALPGDNTLRLESASWPFAEGKLSVRPATWAFRDGDQAFAIDVEDVDLAKLLRLTDVPNLEIDGKVSGVFPIEVRDGNVEIVGGRLRAREGGGMIRYTGPGAASPPPPKSFFARTRERLFGKPAPKGADLAIEALRALEYKILEITVDGRLSGELIMGVVLEGANQQVLSGQPFKFNIKMNVPVGQLLENVNRFNTMGSSPEVLQELDRVMREDAAERARTSGSPPPPSAPPPPPPPPLQPPTP